MKKALPLLPLLVLTLSSCAVTAPGTSATGAAKRGMTKGEIKNTLGTPSYKYAVNQQETWVYKQGNPVVSKAKSTALNMVPVAGPLLSLAANFRPSTEAAKAAVTFGPDDKVTRVEDNKEAAPAKADKPAPKK